MSRSMASLGLMRMIEAVPDRLDGAPRQLRRLGAYCEALLNDCQLLLSCPPVNAA